eukprot:TRINITY_DN59171_c0_g1_i1.p1 TRINITY_DN59171_c0_g1~~TRINITY_DN59171_c0_g1_i1.p1  ORF type:complete len:100 (-),score=12.19 TRINITY_DN59171_c0_g1_i1:109-381(-)
MKFSNLLTAVAVAAAGLVVAPVAAQAGTAAAGSVVSANKLTDFGSRSSTTVRSEENLSGGLLVVLLLAIGAGGYGLYKAIDKNDKSRGAN